MVVEKLDQVLSLLREQRNVGRSPSKRLTPVKQKNCLNTNAKCMLFLSV